MRRVLLRMLREHRFPFKLARTPIPLADLAAVCERLALYLESGISILAGLNLLILDHPRRSTRNALQYCAERIKLGDPLSQALLASLRKSPRVLIGLLQAAERSGRLPTALAAAAQLVRRRIEVSRVVISAGLYPGIMLMSIVGVGVFFTVVTLPALSPTLTALRVELPDSTRALLWMSSVLQSGKYYILTVAAIAISGSTALVYTSSVVRRTLLYGTSRLPVIGLILRETEVGMLLSSLADLLDSGVRVDEALELAQLTAILPWYQAACSTAKHLVRAGHPLSAALAVSAGRFSASTIELITTGEQSGSLPHCLRIAGRESSERAHYRLLVVAKVLEPALLLLLAGIVWFLALAVLMPLYSLTQAVS